MPIDRFEGKLVVKTRDQIRDEYLRDCKLRQPLADTAPGTQPHLDATNFADALLPLSANIPVLGDATTFLYSRGKLLDRWGEAKGRKRRPATGSIGYVQITTATGGSNVVAGDIIKHVERNLRFRVLVSSAVGNQALVGIIGIDTGSGTNLPPGTKLRWLNPRPGMYPDAVVYDDGKGLTGGAPEEDDATYQRALQSLESNPAAMGNEGQLLLELEKIPGIALQAGFVIPAVKGPGTKAVLFTLRPSLPGGSRIPSGAHIAYVEAALKAVYPFDDGIIVATLIEQAVAIVLRVTFRTGAQSFVDQTPWPPYVSTPVKVTNAVAISATAFRVTTSVAVTAPAVGKTIALYNPSTRQFVAKRIASVTAAGANTWDLTFDTSTPSSDTTFAPANGAIVSPWAGSIQDIVEPVLDYCDQQGPGEMFASFDDPGRRRRRFPAPDPETWPSKIENRIVDELFSVVSDAQIVSPVVPYATTVGTPPALAYLHRCTDIAVYPQ